MENPVILYHYPGKSRVQAYFDLLAGPTGQPLEYGMYGMEAEMQAGETQQATEYLVSYEGLAQPVSFYIQEVVPITIEDYQPPLAPVGFTCKSP